MTEADIAIKALHEGTFINSLLSHFNAVEEARKLEKLALHANPLIAFGREAGATIAYGAEATEASLTHARIRVSKPHEEPLYRYFKRIAVRDGTKISAQEGKHGFSASAWLELDAAGTVKTQNGKCHLRLCYPGYTGTLFDGTAQTATMWRTKMDGAWNRQALEVTPFIDHTLKAVEHMGYDIGTVTNGSWSMGANNALASQLYFKHRNIPTAAILGDPWNASGAVMAFTHKLPPGTIGTLLGDVNYASAPRYRQADIRRMLTDDVFSVYPGMEKQPGMWAPTSNTAKYPILAMPGFNPKDNLPAGQLVYIDVRNMQEARRAADIPMVDIMGATHYRVNIANHLAAYDAGILHTVNARAAGQGRM